ncbi:MAG: EF-hand domain-containing protein [Campylobacterota bacterium]|nr:EF-hand domain-containing protein [Campylobacterota bacterium]
MKRFLTVMVSTVALLVTPILAVEYTGRGQGAQGQGTKGQGTKGQGRNMSTYQEFDINKDGKVSKKEFDEARTKRMTARANEGRAMRNAGNAPAFSAVDTDKDGYMSREEFQVYQQTNRQNRQNSGRGSGRGNQ